MAGMHDDRDPGERRLARPPSDRYRGEGSGDGTASDGATDVRAGSAGRGIALGLGTAVVAAAVIVGLGGVLAMSAGLLVVAAAAGYAIAVAVRLGDGAGRGEPAGSVPARPVTASVLAILAVLLGQLGLWLFARSEGGVLAPLDYLGQTFGALVPIQLLLAAAVAWWTAR